MKVVGWMLFFVGILLLVTWFGTRRKSIREGDWEDTKYGAYLWLAVDIVLIVAGLWLKG